MILTGNRRADELNELLESGDHTDDPVAGPLLAVAESLRAIPGADGPRPEFRDALRQRLVAVATVQGVGVPESPLRRAREAGSSWKVQRRLTAVAAGAAVVTGVTGIAFGASRSLPGDPFYGVKRAAEGAQLATTVGTEARGKRHLEFAQTRLAEVEALAGRSSALAPTAGAHTLAAAADASGRTTLIVDTLHAMDVETRYGANDLFAAYRDSGSLEPLRALSRFTHDQYARLHTLLPSLPLTAQPSARSSLALLAVIATDTVRSATGTSGTAPSGTAPTPGQPSTPGVSPAPTSATRTQPNQSSSRQQTSTPATSSAPTSSSPVQVPSPLPTSLPSSLPATSTVPVPAPSLPTIPPLPATTPLPTSVPTLPDLTGLLGQ